VVSTVTLALAEWTMRVHLRVRWGHAAASRPQPAKRVSPEKGPHDPKPHSLPALAVSLNLCMTSRSKMTILHLLNYTGSLLAFNPAFEACLGKARRG
jgi:hypothetical protein